MGFATKRILKDSPDWVMSPTLLPINDPLATWNYWNYISSGAGKFVSAAYKSDDSLYAEDLRIINFSNTTGALGWKSIAYGQGKFVAVNDNGQSAYSSNGQTWTSIASDNLKRSVTYGKGIFVAVGSGSTASYSSNGTTWTQVTIPEAPYPGEGTMVYDSVAYGNGIFVAIASWSGVRLGKYYFVSAVSQNGTTWQSYTHMIDTRDWYPSYIAFGDGKFVVVPNTVNTSRTSTSIAHSSNGTSWTFPIGAVLPVDGRYEISYGAGYFCAINTTENLCYYSEDGIYFLKSVIKEDQSALGIGYGYGKFAIIGGDRISYTKSNRLPSKFSSTNISLATNWNCHAYGRGTHILLSSSTGAVAYKKGYNAAWADGVIQSKAWNDVKYGGGIFVAVSSQANGISYSSNGTSWTNVTNEAESRLSITYGGGKFACVGESNNLMYSSNGSSWTSVGVPYDLLKNIKYGLGRFVIIRNGRYFLHSTNLTTWTESTVPLGNWGKLQYGNGVFVALSETQSNQFIYSKNGTTWVTGYLPKDLTILSFSYGGGIFVAIPSNDKAIISYDGINWEYGINYNYSSGDSNIKTIGYGHGYFYAPVYGTNRVLSLQQRIFRVEIKFA
jgi:hypothetical protein